MDLVQKFFASWESKSLEIILSELQEEIEKKVGSLVDEDNIEKVFCKEEIMVIYGMVKRFNSFWNYILF